MEQPARIQLTDTSRMAVAGPKASTCSGGPCARPDRYACSAGSCMVWQLHGPCSCQPWNKGSAAPPDKHMGSSIPLHSRAGAAVMVPAIKRNPHPSLAAGNNIYQLASQLACTTNRGHCNLRRQPLRVGPGLPIAPPWRCPSNPKTLNPRTATGSRTTRTLARGHGAYVIPRPRQCKRPKVPCQCDSARLCRPAGPA